MKYFAKNYFTVDSVATAEVGVDTILLEAVEKGNILISITINKIFE